MQNDKIKLTAIVFFMIIATWVLVPHTIQSIDRIGYDGLSVIDSSILTFTMICVVLVVISDRITSLKMTKDHIDVSLNRYREELNSTIKEVSPIISKAEKHRIDEVKEKLQNSKTKSDLISEAEDIGQAMAMLREIITSYKDTK